MSMACVVLVLLCTPDATHAALRDASESAGIVPDMAKDWWGTMIAGIGTLLAWIAGLFNINGND